MKNITLNGDCIEQMQIMIDAGVKVQTCITSPPYYGLRDYGMAGQIGMEETPEEFIAKLVKVFAKVKKLLLDDGTLWVNIGDSYAGSGKGRNPDGTVHVSALIAKQGTSAGTVMGNVRSGEVPDGYKPKDLIGIPWMLAFALRADGWYLRQDIIWSKPNPMPESVTDRCTKAHEYIFLLSKSNKYFYDADAIKEPSTTKDANLRNRDESRLNNTPGRTRMAGFVHNDYENRNKRSVWEITTKPCSEAHFAVMPESLVEPCVLAGSRVGDIVFDPFMGSGTVGRVAQALGRNWLGTELNPEYIEIIKKRTSQQSLILDAA